MIFTKEKNDFYKIISLYALTVFLGGAIISILSLIFLKDAFSFPFFSNLAYLAYASYTNLTIYLILAMIVALFGTKYLVSDFIHYKKYFLINIAAVIIILFFNYLGNIASSVFLDSISASEDSINQMSIVIMLKYFFIPAFLASAILAPIIEEIVFRKCIFGLINNNYIAIVISTLSFGLLHVIVGGDYIQSIPYLMSGFIYGIAYIRCKKNIWFLIFAHMLNNIISIILISIL